MKNRTARILSTVAALAVALSACGAGTGGDQAEPTGTPTGATARDAPVTTGVIAASGYGGRYEADVVASNAAIHTIEALGDDPVPRADLTVLAADLTSLAHELVVQSWPPPARADIRRLAADALALAADARRPVPVAASIERAAATVGAGAAVVRADLGLPR